MKTFREAYCEKQGIAPEAFEEEVLWRCFFPNAVSLGKLVWRINRRCFDPDLEMIREVANCTSLSEVRAEISDFHYHSPICGFVRKGLRIRLSGQRLIDLAATLLPENNQARNDS